MALFRKDDQSTACDCKFIQVNPNDLYMIGGNQDEPTLLKNFYKVPRSCIKIDIVTGELTQQNHMNVGRSYGHSLCAIGHVIYVVGGEDPYRWNIDTCESFNVLKN